jgi:hypothetical protein
MTVSAQQPAADTDGNGTNGRSSEDLKPLGNEAQTALEEGLLSSSEP